jgi:hypothetical protein
MLCSSPTLAAQPDCASTVSWAPRNSANLFQPVLGAAGLQEHRGHQRLPALTLQAIDLGAHQRLVIRNA